MDSAFGHQIASVNTLIKRYVLAAILFSSTNLGPWVSDLVREPTSTSFTFLLPCLCFD